MGGGCGRNGVVVGWNGAAEGGDWQSGPAAGRGRTSDGHPELVSCLTVSLSRCVPPFGSGNNGRSWQAASRWWNGRSGFATLALATGCHAGARSKPGDLRYDWPRGPARAGQPVLVTPAILGYNQVTEPLLYDVRT
jgi:hypothetical protein